MFGYLCYWYYGIRDSIRFMVTHMTNDQIHAFYQYVKNNADSLTTIQYLHDTGYRVDNQPIFIIKNKDINDV